MGKQVIDYIRQPESLDNQSLEHLRSVVDKYPYYHAARILLLRILYQRHDPSFDEQLRRAAIYVPSRQTLFQMFQAPSLIPDSPSKRTSKAELENIESKRTATLIDNFLDSIPQQNTNTPRIVDATVDYMAYLMQIESGPSTQPVPRMAGEDYIDNFLTKNNGRFDFEDMESEDISPAVTEPEIEVETGALTEAMARIYIKQGKYDKAIEIIRRISLKYPKKNRYFADQIRFLEKLIINQQS
ncbi:MAG: tetratricopeptide repeat protein [Bacteroidaceae bacterium]|jgi:tetratricopeptide (TPR) repeat protein|nr:tetratricopeptide repeat protein [Bacteroidaceae bacterium]MBQ2363183.1 tetratricopeptide repeat protein [Bacteroidaceae bacterium]MBQ5694508.1 tetratricopeptide repeat protein [Bacteroidaceae bacterium]MBQ5839678.1 tetratricopeptide repeat protein [Bacteroidaceae bacterium]MBQ5911727.1 tetratricopeptide repeat protein [Bacteroidaceae bacterium]